MKSLVSVITVVYNAVNNIEATMCSVLSQNYSNIEYIIVDGGSTDGSVEIIKKYSNRLGYWVSEPDKGIYDAMNKGVVLSHGDWILFMNAGDSFCNPDVLTNLHLEQIKNDISVVYGDSISMYGKDYFYFPPKNIENLRNFGMVFCHQAVLVRRAVLKFHPFDISYRLLSDYNLFRNLFLENFNFKYVKIPICIYCLEDGMSYNNQWLCRKELAAILQQKLSFFTHFYFVLKKIAFHLFRKEFQLIRKCKYRKMIIPVQDISRYIY